LLTNVFRRCDACLKAEEVSTSKLSNKIMLTGTTGKKWTIIPNGYKLIMQKCSYNS
jgi:hypothetical protein